MPWPPSRIIEIRYPVRRISGTSGTTGSAGTSGLSGSSGSSGSSGITGSAGTSGTSASSVYPLWQILAGETINVADRAEYCIMSGVLDNRGIIALGVGSNLLVGNAGM